MQNIQTGEITELEPGDPRIDNPPPGHIVYRDNRATRRQAGKQIATDVQRRVDADAKRAKRKSAKAARKANR